MTDYTNITLDTDELGIWLIHETDQGPEHIGHISWKEVTRGVQQALLQERFLIVLQKMGHLLLILKDIDKHGVMEFDND